MNKYGSPDDRHFTEKYSLENLPGFDKVPEDMQNSLARFNDRAERIVNSFLQTVESHEPPPLIYHYTNDIGLRGILESGEFWLTDMFSLNDPSELSHGFSLAIDALEKRVGSGFPAGKIFAKNFAAFAQQGSIPKTAHFFMCSFSSVGDDLGQWRACADNGRGFALGFDARALENGFTRTGEIPIPNNSTFPITYSDARLTTIHSQIIEEMYELIALPGGRELDRTTLNAYMAELQMVLTLHTLRTTLFFKHEAYKNESEYRFLQIHKAGSPPVVKLRARPYRLIKYREFGWRSVAAAALKEIVIGPAAEYPKASQFVADCLGSFHRETVEVRRSKVPYRAI